MSWEVCIEWRGQSCLVGRLHAAQRGPSVSFEYAPEWLRRPDAFAVDPTSLPLQPGDQHSPALFGAIADCDQIAQMFHVACRKAGITEDGPELSLAAFRRPQDSQLGLGL